jgi:flagellar assembly protein FliH
VATSSEWLGALAQAPASGPAWLAQLDRPGAFAAALPFAPAALAPEPDPEPEPPADPLAEALARAHAEGVAEGRALAEAEAEAQSARQRALRLAFRTLDETALGVLADDLAQTVIALCDGVLAGAAIDREGLIARCHAAAKRIGGAADALALHLHPDDIALAGAEALDGWRVVADPALERGGLLIEGAEGTISDGPAEWRRAIAAGLRG